ncbi:uncharacterized protein LOC131675824 [Topomyia yanbarensis]|uniref:uncharacterized protein LOC131675824 n=1 Tax=Topomyia yanbarensis TaxID=2498891 RepID=UPI00273C0345|nr:uncharacterized protein LOC131675824 [Topomyia yanbarensis]
MGVNSFPPDGGGGPSLSNTLPTYLNSGDVIDQQTLLMRAKDTTESSDQRLPANPFLIHQSVKAALGFDPIRTLTASKEGRGTRYILRTTSKKTYQALLNMKSLTTGQLIEVIPHPTLNIVQGVIFDQDTVNLTSDEVLKELVSQNVVAVRRITKMVEKIPVNTPLLVLSFSGSFLPEYIYLGLVRTAVRQYYPSPMMCFNCGNFGHGSRSCPNTTVCLNCSGSHVVEKGITCKLPSQCRNCKGEHATRSRECPSYMEEESVIKLKVTKNITFPEARALLRKITEKNSYANVLKDRLNPENNEKDRTIQLLREELAKAKQANQNCQTEASKDLEIRTLKAQLAETQAHNLAMRSELAALREDFSKLTKRSAPPSDNQTSKSTKILKTVTTPTMQTLTTGAISKTKLSQSQVQAMETGNYDDEPDKRQNRKNNKGRPKVREEKSRSPIQKDNAPSNTYHTRSSSACSTVSFTKPNTEDGLTEQTHIDISD